MHRLTDTLGAIAAAQPSATRVFLRHRLDFCCGGSRTLAEACALASLDPDLVARELAAESGPSTDRSWSAEPLDALADHIERRYHVRLRQDMPALIDAARRVETVHADKASVPAGLGDHLESMWQELLAHMAKEEQVLFPMIRQGLRGEALYQPLRVMNDEHEQAGAELARTRELTGDLVVPAEACATWRALYTGLAALEAELMEHIHLENNVLFLRAARERREPS